MLKQTASSELKKAIQEAMAGRYYVSPSIASDDMKLVFDPNKNPSELFGGNLTPRQREVLLILRCHVALPARSQSDAA